MNPLFLLSAGSSILGGLSGLANQRTSITQIGVGGQYASNQYAYQGLVSEQANNYTIRRTIDSYNKQQELLGRQVKSGQATQRTQMAVSGFGAGSQTDLDIVAASLSSAEQASSTLRNTASEQIKSLNYQSAIGNWKANEQAKAAKYQADVSQAQAEAAYQQQQSSLFGNIFGAVVGSLL